MSNQPCHPANTAPIDVPNTFWVEVIGYRGRRLQALTLTERERINRLTVDEAAEILVSSFTLELIKTRGVNFALRKAMEQTKERKRHYIECALRDRRHA